MWNVLSHKYEYFMYCEYEAKSSTIIFVFYLQQINQRINQLAKGKKQVLIFDYYCVMFGI